MNRIRKGKKWRVCMMCLTLVMLIPIILTGCLLNIETNIKGTEIFQTTPDYPHVFTRQGYEMDVIYEDHSTRIMNPETGEPFFYLMDEESLYFLVGIRENLRKIFASEGLVQFGLFTDEPRYAENESVDFISMPIDSIIEETGHHIIEIEIIDVPNHKQLAKITVDLTEGGYQQ